MPRVQLQFPKVNVVYWQNGGSRSHQVAHHGGMLGRRRVGEVPQHRLGPLGAFLVLPRGSIKPRMSLNLPGHKSIKH